MSYGETREYLQSWVEKVHNNKTTLRYLMHYDDTLNFHCTYLPRLLFSYKKNILWEKQNRNTSKDISFYIIIF